MQLDRALSELRSEDETARRTDVRWLSLIGEPRLVAALERMARDPEAGEHDLTVREIDRLGLDDEENGEAEPGLTIAEMLERARAFLRT